MPTQGARPVCAAELEDQVVPSGSCRRVLRGVVDHVIRAQAPDQLESVGATHTGDLGPSVFGELDRKGPDASGGADDHHVLIRYKTAVS